MLHLTDDVEKSGAQKLENRSGVFQQKNSLNIVRFSLRCDAKITFVITENVTTINLLTIDKNLTKFYGDTNDQR